MAANLIACEAMGIWTGVAIVATMAIFAVRERGADLR